MERQALFTTYRAAWLMAAVYLAAGALAASRLEFRYRPPVSGPTASTVPERQHEPYSYESTMPPGEAAMISVPLSMGLGWMAVLVIVVMAASIVSGRFLGTRWLGGGTTAILAAAAGIAWMWASPVILPEASREAMRATLREDPFGWSLTCAGGLLPLAIMTVRCVVSRRAFKAKTEPANPVDAAVARVILEGMAARAPETLREPLSRQVEAITDFVMNWTGTGFYANIRMNRFHCHPLPSASLPITLTARSPSLREPVQLTLFDREGYISLLEGGTNGENHPATLIGLEIARPPDESGKNAMSNH